MARKKKTKAERKERRKKILKKVGKAIKKVALAPAKAASFAALIPFQPMLKAAVKKKGIEPKKKLSELAKQFHSVVLQGKNFEEENLIEDIASIVKGIISFFQSKKKVLEEKKAAGEELSEGEENTLDTVSAIEKQVQDTVVDGAKSSIGDFVTSPMGLIVIGLGIFALVKLT